MKQYLKCKKIETAISRAKKNLIKKANKDGIYENFGQTEVREIEEVFIDISNREALYLSILLNHFNNWCMNYTK